MTDVIKKLMQLGLMANVNQILAMDVVELIAVDYGKEVKNAATKDI